MRRTRLYRDGVLAAENFPIADVARHLADPAVVVWCDLLAPSAADLAAISKVLGLHELAVEDAIHDHERPKLHRYESHLFATAYAVRLDAATARLEACEVDAFVTPKALVTVRRDDRFDIDAVVARWDDATELARHGVAFLLHGLLDFVVDSHFDAVQALDEAVDALEENLFAARPDQRSLQLRVFALRKSLVLLRRVVLPMREVVNSLLRRDQHVVDEAMAPYFQDVYDHVLRAIEWTDSLRDLVTGVLETNLTLQSNRLNVIMKQVTSWAAIIAVPTAVTGFYGQNVPYPGYGNAAGFWTSLLVTVGASVGLFWLFRRKGWI